MRQGMKIARNRRGRRGREKEEEEKSGEMRPFHRRLVSGGGVLDRADKFLSECIVDDGEGDGRQDHIPHEHGYEDPLK